VGRKPRDRVGHGYLGTWDTGRGTVLGVGGYGAYLDVVRSRSVYTLISVYVISGVSAGACGGRRWIW
jgi:hypothetical protein